MAKQSARRPRRGKETPRSSGPGPKARQRRAAAAGSRTSRPQEAPAGASVGPPGSERSATPPLVGIGMSAGGLEACTQLLEALPPAPGCALVVVQHLASNTRSALPALLGARSPLPVVEARDGVEVAPNSVYVIPPDHLIELEDGHLRLAPRPADHVRVGPVDHFFTSLAALEGDRAVAVVLSGTGTDGTAGARAVKEQGGTVLVQQPDTARYDGMPRSVIDAGIADLVLAPGEIARKLGELAEYVGARPAADAVPVFSDGHFDAIFELLRGAVGVDFSHYKQPTIRRRILRRMAITRVPDVENYVTLLRRQPGEAKALYQDILIHVTRFFREPESFQALAQSVFPQIFASRRPDTPVRIWVAGCATGEEAYSLAIALAEFAGGDLRERQVQVFGTDISEAAVDFARQGIYPANIAEVIPPDRLRRFFGKVDSGYRIAKSIRDVCIFARQDLTRDPPFSKLDLVLCRNVLIYMDVTLQRRVIPVFHYALKPDGFLVLGHAETVGAASDLFTILDKRHKIYRKHAAEYLAAGVPVSSYPLPRPSLPRAPGGGQPQSEARAIQNEANRVLLDRYSPSGALVNEDLEIVQFRGHTGAYLEPAPGDASLSLLKLAREGLLHGLRSALQSVRKTRKPVRKEGLRVRSEAGWTEVDLDVIPLAAAPTPHYLVLFDRPRTPAAAPASSRGERGRATSAAASKRAGKLEEELVATREYLQSIIQEVEAANEELQSANEEILSSNEELQSTNEELDTAKEELQSTNEELNTLNEEMHARNEELTRVNSDLLNLLGSVEIAIVIVGSDLRVRRFTPMAEKVLNLIPADIGRPITQLKPNIEGPDLGALITEVIDRVSPLEREVRDGEGRWFALRVRPYKNAENRIDGAVVALFDIGPAKRQAQAIAAARRWAETIVRTVTQPVVVVNQAGQVQWLNEAFCEAFRVPPGEGRRLAEFGDGWDSAPVAGMVERLFTDGELVDSVRVEVEAKGGGRRAFVLHGRSLPGVGSEDGGLAFLAVENLSPGGGMKAEA